MTVSYTGDVANASGFGPFAKVCSEQQQHFYCKKWNVIWLINVYLWSYFSFVFFISNGKVLFKWRGSVYKLIFKEMFVYMVLYFFLNVLYRTILVEEGWEEYRYTFESLKGIFRNYIAILIQNKINIIIRCCQI